jgi:hypothetical protein
MVKAALALPTITVPKFCVAGETMMVGGVSPVPVRLTEAAATPGLLVETVRDAVAAPLVTGRNMTWVVQDAPAASVAPQVDVPRAKPADAGPEKAKLGCDSGDPPVLVTVTVFAPLAIPTCTLPRARDVGDTAIAGGFNPAPLSATFCARRASETVSVAVSYFTADGRKVTEIPQEEFAASVPPQLLTAVKSAALGPDTDVPIAVSGSPPVSVNCTVKGADIWPRTVLGKASVVADKESVGPATPVPLKTADCIPAESVMVAVPLAAPACVGAKAIAMEHEAPAASALPQVVEDFRNGAETTIDVIDKSVPPVFCRLIFCVAEVLPTC